MCDKPVESCQQLADLPQKTTSPRPAGARSPPKSTKQEQQQYQHQHQQHQQQQQQQQQQAKPPPCPDLGFRPPDNKIENLPETNMETHRSDGPSTTTPVASSDEGDKFEMEDDGKLGGGTRKSSARTKQRKQEMLQYLQQHSEQLKSELQGLRPQLYALRTKHVELLGLKRKLRDQLKELGDGEHHEHPQKKPDVGRTHHPQHKQHTQHNQPTQHLRRHSTRPGMQQMFNQPIDKQIQLTRGGPPPLHTSYSTQPQPLGLDVSMGMQSTGLEGRKSHPAGGSTQFKGMDERELNRLVEIGMEMIGRRGAEGEGKVGGGREMSIEQAMQERVKYELDKRSGQVPQQQQQQKQQQGGERGQQRRDDIDLDAIVEQQLARSGNLVIGETRVG